MPYDNNMTGFLMINNRKTEPKYPEWSGSAEVEKIEFWAAAWVKEIEKGANVGKKGMSIKLTDKDKSSSIKGDLYLVKEGEKYSGTGEVNDVLYDCNATLGKVEKDGPNKGKHILRLNFFQKGSTTTVDQEPDDDEVPF